MRLPIGDFSTSSAVIVGRLTLVVCLNRTKGNDGLAAVSCSTPMMIPLSIRQAKSRSDKDGVAERTFTDRADRNPTGCSTSLEHSLSDRSILLAPLGSKH